MRAPLPRYLPLLPRAALLPAARGAEGGVAGCTLMGGGQHPELQ